MKSLTLILFAIPVSAGNFAVAQSLPLPAHIVIAIYENHAYENIIGSSAAPYINSLTTDSDAALFTKSYALTHPSQPNYLMLFSGSNQGVTTDDISSVQFTTCNLGASLLSDSISFVGYSESEPSIGYLGATSGEYARKHNPWSNWQGSSADSVPAASNAPYTLFPANFDSLPAVSFVVPNLDDDMHDGTIAEGDTWLKNNLSAYITWAKSHNSLFILTFDEDDDDHGNHITTIFVGQMVKGGSYAENITHYNVLRTIEDIYGLPECANSSSVNPITDIWRGNATGLKQLSFNNKDLSIYPNPSSGQFTIKPKGNENGSSVEVYSALGEKIYQTALTGSQKTIDILSQPAGIYFVYLKSESGIEVEKILITK